jgi:hypothetical protein
MQLQAVFLVSTTRTMRGILQFGRVLGEHPAEYALPYTPVRILRQVVV